MASACKQISNIARLFKRINIKSNATLQFNGSASQRHSLHTSLCHRDLMEFFDDKKNWGENEVKVGRAWKLEELRIKSNSDLHKLWYVLLKERNMLKTMEQAALDAWATFANPERLDKVEESMENLETVVRERNKAYWQLEVGSTGERPSREEISFTGLRYKYKLRQHRIPELMNSSHREFKNAMNRNDDKVYQKEFLSLYREKMWAEKRRKRVRDFNHVCGLIKRFPNLDLEAVKEQYPDVNLDKAFRSARSRGMRDNNTS